MKYEEYLFGDIASFRYGKMPDKNRVSSVGKYPVFSGYRITGYYDEYNLDRGKIVIVARGVGGTGDVKLSPTRCYLTNLSIAAEINEQVADIHYIYYYFTNRNLRYLDSGSAQSQITISDLEKVKVKLPELIVQKRISNILLSIDYKIELNNRINENLEKQAQAIFKSWFVDFEPFGGVMPEDWNETTLEKIALISTKSINPLKQPNLYLEHYSIPAFDEQHYPVFEYARDIKSNKYIITSNSIMISKLNPDTKRIWRPLCISENAVCSTEFIVYEAFNPDYKDYLYSLIDSQAFSDYLCSHTTGSTNSRQRVTPKTTLDFVCILPPDDIIAHFCDIVTPMYNQISAGIIENQHLAAIRDVLLPKLMNGEIDVSNVKI